jgi:single-strand DNA-binding protein
MAASYSKTLLIGNVGKDPEVKNTTGGTLIATLSLATSERYKDKTGNMVDNTEWHNLVAFDRTAEIIRDYVKKGSKLHIEGRNKTRTWDDKDSGKKMYRTEVVVNNIVMLDSKASSEGRDNTADNTAQKSSNSGNNGYAQQNSRTDDLASTEISDLDIPF